MNISSIERAARAFAVTASGVDEWDALDAGTQNRLKEATHAALMAIRKPGASVIRAGARTSTGPYRSTTVQAEAMWQAMIDATARDR